MAAKMGHDSSVEKASVDFERLFGQTAAEKGSEEEKENDFFEKFPSSNHFSNSPKRGGPASASSSAFTRPTGNVVEGNHRSEQQTTQTNTHPPLHPDAETAMARRVANQLLTEARERGSPYHSMTSPMARMRNNSFQMDAMTSDNDRPPKKETKSDREVKKEKQRQWKKKAQIAKAKQRRERQALRDEYTVGSSHFGDKTTTTTTNPIIGCVLDNVEKTDFFKRLQQCSGGGVPYNPRNACNTSEYEESEYGSASSTGSEFYSTEGDDDTLVDDDGRERQQQRKKKWDDSSMDGPSVDTTVPEELTRSFLSEDSADHREEGAISRSKAELNQSLETTATDYAFVAYSSFDNSSKKTASRNNRSSNLNNRSPNRHMPAGKTPNYMKAFLQDMESKGESMLWHQETSSMDPTTIVVRLKQGYRLANGRYCAPRLIWTDVRNNENYGFDVFEIKSLDHASVLHLKDFPYAMPGRSVLLHLRNSSTFIFEAGTEEEMMRFVCGIRWVVARMAHNLAVGNVDGSCEMLDLGFSDPKRRSMFAEFDWSRAMDDVTEAMIDNALASSF